MLNALIYNIKGTTIVYFRRSTVADLKQALGHFMPQVVYPSQLIFKHLEMPVSDMYQSNDACAISFMQSIEQLHRIWRDESNS